jgi:hypothetical protein
MTNNDQLLVKLETKFPGAAFTALARSGNWPAAADAAAGVAWGIWAECRHAAGLDASDLARNEWIAEQAAKRKAKFAK